MGIATAKAEAARADQEVITARKQGDAKIAKIKAEEEAKAQQMIVAAERENKVQILNAQREVEISKLKKQEEESIPAIELEPFLLLALSPFIIICGRVIFAIASLCFSTAYLYASNFLSRAPSASITFLFA